MACFSSRVDQTRIARACRGTELVDGQLSMECCWQIRDVSARYDDQRVRSADLAVERSKPDGRAFILVLPIARPDLEEKGGEGASHPIETRVWPF